MALKDYPLPPALEAKWGHLAFLHYKGSRANEWSAACPKCGVSGHDPNAGDPDRFVIRDADSKGNARGFCRKCGHFEWLDDGQAAAPDPVKIRENQEARERMAAQEQAIREEKIKRLRQESYWRGWHDAMTAVQRDAWRRAGIPDDFQDYWELGYNPSYTGYVRGEPFASPALTIPYFAPGRDPYTIQYRLLNPPKPEDKYRFAKDLDSGLWLADPMEPPRGRGLVFEGMKKAAVGYIEMVMKANIKDVSVVSVPSKKPRLEILDGLAECDQVFLLWDPDAYESVRTPQGLRPPAIADSVRYLKNAGHDVRLIKLPDKADDMIMAGIIDGAYLGTAMRRARRV